jgi:radical SAM protein with 4Fe4S-binding SPASM domain
MDDALGIVQVETSTACQAKCRFCPTGNGLRTRNGFRMGWDLFTSIVNQARDMGVRIIIPYGNNEFFLDKRWPDIMDYLFLTGMDVYLNTNVSLLGPDKIDKLIQYPNLKEMTLSLHGWGKENYEAVMGLPFEQTRANAHYLIDHAPFPVRLYFLRYEDTLDSEAAFRAEWGERASVSDAFFNWSGEVVSDRNKQFELPQHPCSRVLNTLFVLASGKVALCCMDYDGKVELGDLNAEPLADVWARNQPMRDRHHANDFDMPLCKNCNMNRW